MSVGMANDQAGDTRLSATVPPEVQKPEDQNITTPQLNPKHEVEPETDTAILFHVICGDEIGEEFLVHADCSLKVMLNFIKLRLKTDVPLPDNAMVELFDEEGEPLGLSKADPYDRGYSYVKHRGVYFPMFFVPTENEEEDEEEGDMGASDEMLLDMKTRPSTFIGITGEIHPEDHMSTPSRSLSQPSRNRKKSKFQKSRKKSRLKSRANQGTLVDYKEDEGENDNASKSKPTSRGHSRPHSRAGSATGEEQHLQSGSQKPTSTPIDEDYSADKSEPWKGDPPVTPNELTADEFSEIESSQKHDEVPADIPAALDHHAIVEFAGEGIEPLEPTDASLLASSDKARRTKSQSSVGEKSKQKNRKTIKSESAKRRKGDASDSGPAMSKSSQSRSKKLIEVELSSTPSLAMVEASKEEFETENETFDANLITDESAQPTVHKIQYFPDKKPVKFVPIVSKTFKGCLKLCKWVVRLHEEIDKGVKDMDCMVNDMAASFENEDEEEMPIPIELALANGLSSTSTKTSKSNVKDGEGGKKRPKSKRSKRPKTET